MIVEMRTYTLHPGKVGQYLALYQAEGLATQTRILGKLVGYYSTEIGDVNQVVHLWAYDSFEERMKRRGALFADPTWLAYIPKIAPMLISQESKILNPAKFSPPP
jgi:hypothetical protein